MPNKTARLRDECRRLCERLAADSTVDMESQDEAEAILALTRAIVGIACPACSGYGHRSYGDTSTWHGGGGGQAITEDVCDRCWGTGRSDKKGANLRAMRNAHARH